MRPKWKFRICSCKFCVYLCLAISLLFVWIWYLESSADKLDEEQLLWNGENWVDRELQRFLFNLSSFGTHMGQKQKYLVKSSKCKIPNVDPWDPEILPYHHSKEYIECSNEPLLTYVEKGKNDEEAFLYINQRYIGLYGAAVRCCYSYITRGITDMDYIVFEPCIYFNHSVSLTESIVIVTCKDDESVEVYKNTHTVTLIKSTVKKKLRAEDKHLSILMIGIDSVSRLNSIRSLPKTAKFMQKNDFIEFRGYNKINDNTFPNVMAILTGMNRSNIDSVCDPTIVGQLDRCKILWYDYRARGFVTAYAEDQTDMNTFTLSKKGFSKEPTDYYYRTYLYASDELLPWKKITDLAYCTGPENSGERVLNIARDFTSTFRNHSSFGLFWTSSFSHDDLNSVSMMDSKLAQFLRDLRSGGIFENSVVIFFSDHGIRFGKYLYTHPGWLEERLPMLNIRVPDWFQTKYSKHYRNLLRNAADKLTTPYDLYMTLQHLMFLSDKSYRAKKSTACPKCVSLFHKIPQNRSCADAAIPHHWCTCSGYSPISPSSDLYLRLVLSLSGFLLNEVRKNIRANGGDFSLCESFSVHQVISAGISDMPRDQQIVYLLVTFTTLPEAVFQGTISVDVSSPSLKFELQGSISRLDYYSKNSWCAMFNDQLRKYCYCRGAVGYLKSLIASLRKRLLST